MVKFPLFRLLLIFLAVVEFSFAVNPSDDMELVHYRLGLKQYKDKDYSQAISSFNRMLTFRPNHAPSHHLIGLCNLEKGDIPQAIASLRKASRFDANNVEIEKALADAYEKNGEIERAMSHLRTVINKEPDAQKRGVYEKRIANLLSLSRVAVAQGVVEAPIDSQSGFVKPVVTTDTLLVRASKLVQEKKYEEAIKEVRFLLTKRSDKKGAYYYAALARMGLGQNREALINFKRAEADPDFAASARAYIAQLSRTPQSVAAVSRKATKSPRDSLSANDSLVAARITVSPYRFQITDKLNFVIEDTASTDGRKLLTALDLYLAERPDPALNHLRNIYQNSPRSKEADNALYGMALIYSKLRLWQNALPLLYKINREYPKGDVAASALSLLGHVYAESDALDSAIAVFDRYIAQYPKGEDGVLVRMAKGNIFMKQNRFAAARNAFVEALPLALGETKIELNERLGECHWKMEEPAKAIEFLLSAVSDSTLKSQFAERAAFRLADCYFRIKNFENALRYYTSASRRFPMSSNVPWALYQVGNIHRRGGQIDAAVKAYDRLASEFPGDYWTNQAKRQREDALWDNEYKEILR